MISQNKIAQVIDSFFDANQLDGIFRTTIIVALREDGVLLYSNQGEEGLASIGALMGGAWQAAHALMNIVPNTDMTREIMRFSFDTSSSGVYILPLEFGDQRLFLGMIFQEEVNPALLKNRMRELTQKLNLHFADNEDEYNITKEVQKNSEFLFNEISDDEIDNLFSFTGE